MNERFSPGVMICVALGACGGVAKKSADSPKTELVAPEHDDDAIQAEPQEPPKQAPPKTWYAAAALTPNKGTKLKPFIVTFSQEEDQDTSVAADAIQGLKPGTYHLVVHDAGACGPNATKAGDAWSGSNLQIIIAKDLSGGLESNTTQLMLDGETAITRHVLVLHEDKKGKPGKAIACGAIEPTEAP